MEKVYEGGCVCGWVRYSVRGKPAQRAHGCTSLAFSKTFWTTARVSLRGGLVKPVVGLLS